MEKENFSNRLAIVTTVSNWRLYRKALKTFPTEIDKIAIDGTKGLYGLSSILFTLKKMRKTSYDWIIFADEDVFFNKNINFYCIIKFMISNNYVVSGVRDGGAINHRKYNPYAINSFFFILNYKIIKNKISESDIINTKYLNSKNLNLDNLNLNLEYNLNSFYEPYYSFFFWLLNMGLKINYLNLINNYFKNDKYSTVVIDSNNKKLLVHTWFAREYGKSSIQTNRIDKIFDVFSNLKNENTFVVWKDYKSTLKFWIKLLKKKFKR